MIYIQKILCFGLVMFTSIVFSQKENIFLERAYWKSNPTIEDIEQKISEGHDVTELNKFFFDAVSWAFIERVDNKTIKHLLSKKGNYVNKLTHDGRTYIFWAAYRGNLEMMQFLVDKGAKTDVVDSHGYSLLNFAAVTGQLDTKLYDFCIANGANITKEKSHDGANALLLVAPFVKDYALVEYFISKGIDLHSVDDHGNGIFNYAAKRGNIEFLDTLIKKGVIYKGLNKKGGNAMLFASQGTRGHSNPIETFLYLEKLGIDINVTTKNGETPLHALAYKAKDIDVLEYFISNGVDINQKNKDGKSALINAIARNSVDIVSFLLDNGADVSIKDKNGNNLAYYLVEVFNPQKPEVFDEKLAVLIKNGFNFFEEQKSGNTLYHLVVKKNNLTLLKRIKNDNIPINAKNKEGNTALHIAAMKAQNEDILKYLISIGADKSIKTGYKESVYDLAVENEQLQKRNVALNFLK